MLTPLFFSRVSFDALVALDRTVETAWKQKTFSAFALSVIVEAENTQYSYDVAEHLQSMLISLIYNKTLISL